MTTFIKIAFRIFILILFALYSELSIAQSERRLLQNQNEMLEIDTVNNIEKVVKMNDNDFRYKVNDTIDRNTNQEFYQRNSNSIDKKRVKGIRKKRILK